MTTRKIKNIRFLLLLLIMAMTVVVADVADVAAADAVNMRSKVVQYAPDQILVRFKSGVSASAKAIAYGDNPPVAIHSFKSISGLQMLTLPPGTDVQTAIQEYQKNPNVLYAEPDNIVGIESTNDTSFTQLWGLNNTGQTVNGVSGTSDADMNVVEAWANSGVTGSNSVVIGVIDTGVQYNHPDLANNVWVNPGEIAGNGIDDDSNGYVDDVYGINAITNSGNPMDDNNHGTHVSGTIAAVGQNSQGITGINQQAKILACKFLNSAGSGTDSNALKCLDYIYALKMKGVNIVVTNNSWGGAGGGSQSVADAIKMHQNAGILFVAAAGNSTVNNDTGPHYPSSYYKANMISVAATDQNDGQATFSNYGRRSVHVGAPGVNIYSSVVGSGYSHFQGTSMAAPHVAGLAALLSAEDPTRDWKTIKNLIITSGTLVSSLTNTTVTGRRVRAWDTNGTGAMTCSNQTVSSVVYPHVTTSTKIAGTKLGLAAMNINCGSPAGTVTITTTGPAAVGIVSMMDDGLEFDDVAGDGIYSGYWTAPTTAGTYTLTFSNGQTQTVTVISNNSTLQSYRAPVEIAYNPRVDPLSYPFSPMPDNAATYISGYTSYFNVPVGGVNTSVIYAIPQGGNMLVAPTAGQLTGANSTLPSDIFETFIAGYWDDLNLNLSGYGINAWSYYNSAATPVGEVIFEWRGKHKTTGNTVQFQIVYTANSSDIEMHYIATDNNAESATVGIQVDWVRASSQSFNIVNPDLASGKAWKWSLDTGAPTANAGTDQNVTGNSQVTLSGSGSDPDGGTLNYNWSQTAGTLVTLTGANTLTPSFYAPNNTETMTFKLTVTDDSGQSATDTVNVNVTAGAPAGSLQFSSITYSANEADGNAIVTVTRTGGSGGIVGLSYATGDSSAFSPGDYTYTSGSLSWADGDATSKTFVIPLINDSVVESNETVSLFLLNATGGATLGTKNATLSIVNDDLPGTVAFSNTLYSVNESGVTATITVTRTVSANGVVTVDYATANGTAIAGSDYTATTGTLTWVDGDSADKTFTVAITNDTVVEGNETISLTLSGETGGAILGTNSASLTIVDNDNAGTIGFSAATYSVNENGTTATITASRTSSANGIVTVDYTTVDGTALAGSDYTLSSGTLTWADADSADKTFTVAITNDASVEGDETLSLALSGVTGSATLGTSSATLTIADDDNAVYGVLSISSATYSVNENGGSVSITVSRTGGSDGIVGVDYTSADASSVNSANAGSDYTVSAGTLSWANGDATSKTFSVNISDDAVYEGDEIFLVNLLSATGSASIGTSAATVTIVENDLPVPGTLSISDTNVIVAENGVTATITVARTSGSDGAVSVVFASVDDTALAGEDYTSASGTLNWADGESASKSILVNIVDDNSYEGDESFAVGLSGVGGGANIGVADVIVTITDNDAVPTPPSPVIPGTLSLLSGTFNVVENAETAVVTIVRTDGSDGAVSVDYSIAAGSATLDSDFTMTSGTVSWADGDTQGKTFSIVILDDLIFENDETVNITLSNIIGGATLGTAQSTLTISDDDIAPVAQNQPPEAPILISPANGSTGINPGFITFDWNEVTDPDGDAVSYLLEYCVNADFTNCNVLQAATVAQSDDGKLQSPVVIAGLGGGAGLGIALLGLMGTATRRQRIIQVAALIALSLIMSACGTNIPLPNGDGTMSQSVTNLQSNTTYYWKVTATDTQNLSATSEVWSFTTL